MVADTFDEILRGFSRHAPFEPFSVELLSGKHFTVEHPEALVFRDGVAVYIAPGGKLQMFDHERVSRLGDAFDRENARD